MTELPIDENTPRILIVEDEPKLGQLLIDYLRAASYAPTLISHGDQVLPYVRQTPPDLILLDLMLPGTDGLTLCREIRRFSDIPIVMVTAKIEEIDRLLGLEIGADDYICKPYSPREVVARVKTILRRCKPQRELQQQDAESPLIIDEGRFQASWRGKMLDLTPAEFRLLKTLSHEPGKVFSREQLLNHLYDDYRVVTDRTIDSHIKNLRRKLNLSTPNSHLSAPFTASVTAGKPTPAASFNIFTCRRWPSDQIRQHYPTHGQQTDIISPPWQAPENRSYFNWQTVPLDAVFDTQFQSRSHYGWLV